MIDPFADPARPYMARATHMVGGYAVVVSPYIPTKQVASTIVPKHPLVRWLLRWVPRRWRCPWYRVGDPVVEEQFLAFDGKIMCTPAGLALLKQMCR